MTVITREDVRDVIGVLGMSGRLIERLELRMEGMTVKEFLTDEDGHTYWDEAYGGVAWVEYSVVLSR